MKCARCKVTLAYSHEHGHPPSGLYEVGANEDGFPPHTIERCRDRAAKNLDTAIIALRRIQNAEMSPTPPHTVNAGVRLVAADALRNIEGPTS